MSRAYKEVDGTVNNVGNRVIDDYDYSGHRCCQSVGQYITNDLKHKLALPMVKSLGFTSDKLTISMGDIYVANTDKVNNVLTKLHNIGAFSDMEFDGNYLNYDETIEFLKKKKTEYVYADWDERHKRERDLGSKYNRYIPCAFVGILDDNRVEEAFRSNDASKALFGIKPSKFLSRYVENILPGITEEYALAYSETHTLHVMLTIDPNIMINCSESATFSSCFTHYGEYHYSAQRYANSKDAAMAVVFDDNGYILARNWVMISPSRDAVLTLQVYSSIGGGNIGKAMKELTREFVLDTDEYIEGYSDDIRICGSDDSYIDGYEYYILSTYDEDWIPSLGDAYDIEDGSTTYDAELNSGMTCDCCGTRTNNTIDIDGYVAVCDHCLYKMFTFVEHRGYSVHNSYVVYDVHGEPQHEADTGETHEEHERTDELYPRGELVEAHEGGLYELDELTHSEMLDRHYYDTDILDDDEEEYLKDTEEGE